MFALNRIILGLLLIIFASPVYSASAHDAEGFSKATWKQKEKAVDALLKRDGTGTILPVEDRQMRLQIIATLSSLTDEFSNPKPSEEVWNILYEEEGTPGQFFNNMVDLVTCFPDKEALPVLTRNEIMGPFIDKAYAGTVKFGDAAAELVLKRYQTESAGSMYHLIWISQYLLTPPAQITPAYSEKLRHLIFTEAKKPSPTPEAIEAKQYIDKEFAVPTDWHSYPYRNPTNTCAAY